VGNLIFIYRANSGVLANLPGAIAKAFGGMSTCSLCNITHGPVHGKPRWERLLASLPERPEIYHANEVPADITVFLREQDAHLPVVLEREAGRFSLVVSSEELAACSADPDCLAVKLAAYLKSSSCNDGVCSIPKPS
jgi:hypothetical protein